MTTALAKLAKCMQEDNMSMRLNRAELKRVIKRCMDLVPMAYSEMLLDLITNDVILAEAVAEANAANAAAAKPADKSLTDQDIIDYATMRANRAGDIPPFDVVSKRWRSAADQFRAGNPNKMIEILREDLAEHQNRAEDLRVAAHTLRSADRDRGEQFKEADKIRNMLALLAEKYGVERVWADTMQ